MWPGWGRRAEGDQQAALPVQESQPLICPACTGKHAQNMICPALSSAPQVEPEDLQKAVQLVILPRSTITDMPPPEDVSARAFLVGGPKRRAELACSHSFQPAMDWLPGSPFSG